MSASTAHASAQHPIACHNCGTPVSANFCGACGESSTLHVPGAFEFIHEFVGHFVALEGKLWRTLQLLLFRPGQLTVDFLRGRRVPYIPPLRLYLTLSLVVFALIKLVGIELPHLSIEQKKFGVSYNHQLTNASKLGKTATGVLTFTMQDDDGQATMAKAIDDRISDLGRVNAQWAHQLREFIAEKQDIQVAALNHGFLAYLPYMLIGTLPLFALYVKLLYWHSGRTYGAHLVFALHANCFAFLLASCMIILPGNFAWAIASPIWTEGKFISVWDVLQLLPLAWMIVYLPLAMRRVYGGSALATVLRWLVLITAHLSVVALATVVAELIGIVGHA